MLYYCIVIRDERQIGGIMMDEETFRYYFNNDYIDGEKLSKLFEEKR